MAAMIQSGGMERQIAMIGFGEAASAFAVDRPSHVAVAAYDRKTDEANERNAKLADYARTGVTGCDSPAEALHLADAAFSLVIADQALAAAQAGAPHLSAGALWLDMNSVAPETKRMAAASVGASGGRYVDVALMAPVHPAGRDVPLLVCGPHADAAIELLGAIGFMRVRRVDGRIGSASAIKMIRSVMVKGIEALTAECMLAAEAAAVRDEVLASLDASERARPWDERADYNLDRMMVHGLRRAAEMEEVVKTLESLGTGSVMSRGTVERQRALGSLGLAPPAGLGGKLAALTTLKQEKAA
jgi:3-hydroxyisobutyrate dehydrogenase-like beta-hydroxyacid dehydrogenase